MSNNVFNCGVGESQSFSQHLCEFIGETVTIFTASGGISGGGFTGCVFSVNCGFVRLITQQGEPPTCPISDICNEAEMCSSEYSRPKKHHQNVGSVCDIPICQIVCFCHNAV